MAEKYFDQDILRLQLFDVHNLQSLLQYDRYSDYDVEGVSLMMDSFKSFADQELFPYYREMDRIGVQFEDGKVIIHPQIDTIIKKSVELGFIGAGFDYESGGMQLPSIVRFALQHILDAANNHVNGYTTLTDGAAKLILTFGNSDLISHYVPKMMSGQWLGTMALTEPQAGSSLQDLSTTAYPRDDGSYDIRGQKMFISGGDHQFGDNIIHLTLVRIEGAPAGTKGISLFVVPARRSEDGELVDNDVKTAAEIEKLGQKGYATTHLVFGENDNCRGWLVGEANHGLMHMFQMMNEARISVGITATSMATAAYYASLQYANERRQGRPVTNKVRKDLNMEPVPIIEHPDVRRMLLLQKAVCEGSLSLVLECARLNDLAHVESTSKGKDAHLLLELLTPVCKTYPSEGGARSISQGLQVLGGYGYTMDFPLQQYYRDIRITSIYEGTTGIQSLDLLGRKIPLSEGRAFRLLMAEMKEEIALSKDLPGIKPYAGKLESYLTTVVDTTNHLLKYATEGDYQRYLADASLYMDMFSRLVLGWQWLKIGVRSLELLKDKDPRYTEKMLEDEMRTMRFYYRYEMPSINSLAEVLQDSDYQTLEPL